MPEVWAAEKRVGLHYTRGQDVLLILRPLRRAECRFRLDPSPTAKVRLGAAVEPEHSTGADRQHHSGDRIYRLEINEEVFYSQGDQAALDPDPSRPTPLVTRSLFRFLKVRSGLPKTRATRLTMLVS